MQPDLRDAWLVAGAGGDAFAIIDDPNGIDLVVGEQDLLGVVRGREAEWIAVGADEAVLVAVLLENVVAASVVAVVVVVDDVDSRLLSLVNLASGLPSGAGRPCGFAPVPSHFGRRVRSGVGLVRFFFLLCR